MNDGAVPLLVTLLDRVRDRSRSRWPALVEGHHDDEAVGHEAFAELEESALERANLDDDVIESSPRIKVLEAGADRPAPLADDGDHVNDGDDGDAPVLEFLGESALGDIAEAAVAEAFPLLEHVTLGELVAASLALRPRADAW